MRKGDRQARKLKQKVEKQKVLASHKFVVLCGRMFLDTDPGFFPSASYRGRTVKFCTESCLGAFLADPEAFYKVHRNSEKGNNYVETQ